MKEWKQNGIFKFGILIPVFAGFPYYILSGSGQIPESDTGAGQHFLLWMRRSAVSSAGGGIRHHQLYSGVADGQLQQGDKKPQVDLDLFDPFKSGSITGL